MDICALKKILGVRNPALEDSRELARGMFPGVEPNIRQ
jgi:hypothetical protein